ncbi:MAG: adenosylhomocysteinase, partial [Solirubrobacteraceae bacterium]
MSAADHDVADLALAEAGQGRIAWADGQMPVLRSIRERFERERPLDGVRVAACLHVTSETANLLRTLIAGGAQAWLCASNPLTTQDDVAAALVDRFGVGVHAVRGEDADTYAAHVVGLAARSPHVTLDDGADLLSVLHAGEEAWRAALLGGTEETTTGLVRLRALEHDGLLRCPVLGVNESLAERTFNDRYGTGQSTLDGI